MNKKNRTFVTRQVRLRNFDLESMTCEVRFVRIPLVGQPWRRTKWIKVHNDSASSKRLATFLGKYKPFARRKDKFAGIHSKKPKNLIEDVYSYKMELEVNENSF